MNKVLKVFFAVIGIAIIVAVVYWQYNKKFIVRKALEKSISKGTDSLYFIRYDSSRIDAVKGDASFFNVSLQSDSLQTQLAQYDTASAETILHVQVAEVSIRGANIPAMLRNEKMEANSIHIIRPLIYVIGSGNKKKEFSKQDTLALYEKLLGKFDRISAGKIVIEDGQINFSDKIDTAYLAIQGVNITLRDVLIDSTKNYDNIISYFINDATVSVKKAVYKDKEKNTVLMLSDLDYDAASKQIRLRNFQQQARDSGAVLFDINNTVVDGVNTDAFILRKQLKANMVTTDGGMMTFFSAGAGKTGNDMIDMNNDFFNEALLNAIRLGKTTIRVFNKASPSSPPLIVNNFRFNASDIQSVESGTSLRYVIGKSNWEIAADGFSTLTKNKLYKISLGAFTLNKQRGELFMNSFSVKPTLSEARFVASLKEQTDLYSVTLNRIRLIGLDVGRMITERSIIAETLSLEPTIKVSCDRTVPPFTGSKIGNYPHQLIKKLEVPIFVKTVRLSNGYVSYTERASQSEKLGTVFFSKANGTVLNVTNIPSYIKQNKNLSLNAQASFLGVSKLTTKWALDLSRNDGAFVISGTGSGFNAATLNPLIEPLALASIKNGQIDGLTFSMTGNDNGSKGTCTLLYHDLKVSALKVDDEGDLKRKALISRLANLLVKDENPKNGETRSAITDVERDKTRSFFNLVWKGIFKACKRIALGKDDVD